MNAAAGPSTLTVILPTYNRAGFLPGAFNAIASQTFRDWDLIIVDDGSTDGTRAVAEAFARESNRPVRYVYQANRGAYGARNRGLDEATGKYVAFYDSDDLWLPHHLDRCVTALQSHPELDWVYGACRMVDQATGKVLEETTFHVDGGPRPFLSLRHTRDGDLHLIDDPASTACQIYNGLFCGLQNSVMKRSVFETRRFNERSRVVDDEMMVVRVLAAGGRFAYYLEPHVIYQVHADNSSASATESSLKKHVEIYTELTAGLEQLLAEVPLDGRERRALLKRLGREYFWHLGYVGYWQAGRRRDALQMFRRGLSVYPWHPSAWKTYLLARLKVAMQGGS